ncbi:hypothetical protein ACFV8Z_41075 [Streptomyces sp. NPDC059837]|jgi:hypothetical protein|uniref:hypothetical protein n=1 Tax=unclassified Streptomyces TaxID=2593676 RepID=UPI0022576A97|nr:MULTISPECIES: hypothetical protein [unclassified Streptomyces]MCX4405405.1 hypothetical protein [Streptomyces sp. NBC_01764]MCX5190043.1 hypothetical protein [Streptomyces sp. NBC_00268]
MAEFRQSSRLAGVMPRRLLPPPALCGFLLLLALAFSVSYAVGSAAGPVAPGMHGTGSAGTGSGGDSGSGGGVGDMPGMHGSGE